MEIKAKKEWFLESNEHFDKKYKSWKDIPGERQSDLIKGTW